MEMIVVGRTPGARLAVLALASALGGITSLAPGAVAAPSRGGPPAVAPAPAAAGLTTTVTLVTGD